MDTTEVINEKCGHKQKEQKEELKTLLLRHSKLFDGTLGEYPGAPMHIELQLDAVPVYKLHHPVPRIYLETF